LLSWNFTNVASLYDQGCQIFLDTKYQTGENIPNNNQNITKCPFKMQKCPKKFRLASKYINLFPYQGPPKFTQIGIFGLKTYHLATLFTTVSSRIKFVTMLKNDTRVPAQTRLTHGRYKGARCIGNLLRPGLPDFSLYNKPKW
jgi:hypothetical protein